MTIEDRIIKQLGRRQQKLNCIAEWEKPVRIITMKRSVIGLAIAACLTLLLVVKPFFQTTQTSAWDELGLENPTLVDFRAGSQIQTEIDLALADKDYETALRLINTEIAASDARLSELMLNYDEADESLTYEKEWIREYDLQLQWVRIYSLVRLNRHSDAILELEQFVHSDSEHQDSAQTLLNLLMKRQNENND